MWAGQALCPEVGQHVSPTPAGWETFTDLIVLEDRTERLYLLKVRTETPSIPPWEGETQQSRDPGAGGRLPLAVPARSGYGPWGLKEEGSGDAGGGGAAGSH